MQTITSIKQQNCRFLGASLSEPQGVMMSTALACVRTCVHACVRTCVSVGEACLGTSEVWDSVAEIVWLRMSAKGQDCLARHGSREAKKRFVPEKFLLCACSYDAA